MIKVIEKIKRKFVTTLEEVGQSFFFMIFSATKVMVIINKVGEMQNGSYISFDRKNIKSKVENI